MLGFRFRKFDAGAPPQRRPVWAVFALLALSVSALSADSPSGVSAADGNGGFLYSRYLHNAQNAAGAADGGRIGSFRVQIHRSAFISAAGRERLRAAAGRELQGLSPSSFAPGYLADGRGDLAADFSAATEAGFGRLADAAARELFFAATDDARTVGSLRRVQVEVQTPLGGRRGNIAFDFIGELSETEFDAAAWQLRAFATEDESEGANFGLLYRRATERLLYGVNSFVDYETADEGGFFRWSAGGELRSPWLDFFGNYYRAITDPYAGVDANDLPTATYTADGYDLEINLHSPRYPWISAVLGWYFYEGYEDRELALFRDDEEGVRAGLKLTPRNFPLEAEFEYERAGGDGGDEFGGRLVLHHIIGRTRSAGYAEGEFRPQDWFFAPAEREHTQRIYTVGISTAVINSFLFLRSLAPAGGELSVSGQPPANATTAINLVATGAANGGFTVDGNVGGAAVAATVAAADPEGYGLPDATVLTVETGAPVNSTLVSAFFVYQDGRTSVTVGSTVAFYPPADNGGRRIDLLDGQIVVETDAPVTALVMSAAAAVATVAISPGDAVTVGFAAGTVSVFSEDGNFSVNGGTGGCANVGVSDGGDVSLAVECSLTYTLAENSAFAADAGITLNVSGGNVEIVRVEPAALPDLHFAELTPSGGVGTDYSVVKASTNVSVDLSDGAHTGSQLSLASSFTSGTTTLTLDVVSTSAIDGVPDRTVTAEIIVAVRATTETLSDLTLNENSGYETGNVSLTIGGGNITISYLETETLPAVHFADLSAGGGVGTYVFSIADDPDSAISLGTDDTQLFLDLADPDPFISGTTTVTLAVESGTGALAQTVSAAFTLRVIREELPELVAEFRDSDGDTVGGDEVLTLTVDNNDLEDTQIATVFIDGGEPPYMITDGGGNLSLSLNAATDEGAAYITMFALSDISSRPDLWTITA
ncbi:MAG: inverse autotransporter beta domain-containing protein, partial [Gammaproteobacteria bacterium]